MGENRNGSNTSPHWHLSFALFNLRRLLLRIKPGNIQSGELRMISHEKTINRAGVQIAFILRREMLEKKLKTKSRKQQLGFPIG
jgi:hypothetical protein